VQQCLHPGIQPVLMLYFGLNEEAVKMSSSETNYCKKDKMSICTAKDSKQQEKCSFFEKSSYEHRCMYFIFDEYCDCLNAQIQTK
jgi:hypothetical protein